MLQNLTGGGGGISNLLSNHYYFSSYYILCTWEYSGRRDRFRNSYHPEKKPNKSLLSTFPFPTVVATRFFNCSCKNGVVYELHVRKQLLTFTLGKCVPRLSNQTKPVVFNVVPTKFTKHPSGKVFEIVFNKKILQLHFFYWFASKGDHYFFWNFWNFWNRK